MAKKGTGNYCSKTIENDDGGTDLSDGGQLAVAAATIGDLEREIEPTNVSSYEAVFHSGEGYSTAD